MNKNIPNAKMNERRHIQGASALLTLTAMLTRIGRETRPQLSALSRLEFLPYARAEAHLRTGRWSA